MKGTGSITQGEELAGGGASTVVIPEGDGSTCVQRPGLEEGCRRTAQSSLEGAGTHTHTYISTCTYRHVHIHMHIDNTCTHVHVYSPTFTYIYAHTYIYAYRHA